MPELTHFDAAGDAHMVDVGDKQETKRIAIARGSIRMLPETFALIRDGNAKKGDVIGIVAGTPMGVRGTTNFMKFHVIGGEN